MKYRIIGLVILAICGAMAYLGIVEPLEQARQGQQHITDASKVVFLLPLGVLVSLGLILGGGAFFRLITNDHGKFTAIGWLLLAVGAALGIGLGHFWYDGLLQSLGYRRG